MADDLQHEVTIALDEIRAGHESARSRLAALVYDELRRRAADLLRRERRNHSWQPTELVHEVFLRLLCPEALANTRDRAHFYLAAARAMRQLLVDHARRRTADKRGRGQKPLPLDEALDRCDRLDRDVLAVHEALNCLAELNERQRQIVELRFYGGHTMKEIAELLEISVSTVESDFRKAAAFLRLQILEEGGHDSRTL
jgi:RNA polymerase sigma factor (TIGR02999 family)